MEIIGEANHIRQFFQAMIKASYNYERSHGGLEAFQVGLKNDRRGNEWSYKANGAITGIMINMNSYVIGSLVFQSVDENGHIEYSDSFGSYNTDTNVFKITLDWPQEYLTSLGGGTWNSVSHSDFYITNIYFQTNKRKYGPFQTTSRANGSFEFPLTGRAIVGFYGRETPKDDLGGRISGGLGVYVKHFGDLFGPSSGVKVVTPKTKLVGSFNQEECIKVGPCGWSRSLQEEEWTYMLKVATQIKIGYNENYIQSISFKTSDANSDPFIYSQKSDTKVAKQETIPLNFPEEYLVSISGTTRSSNNDIESLCFYTNKRIYGPFGPMKGNRFRFYMKGGVVVGFHGRVGNFFDALGVYVKSFSELSGEGQNDNNENCNKEAPKVRPSGGQAGSCKEEDPTKVGPIGGQGGSCNKEESTKVAPCGGQGGTEWDYKPNGAITEIIIGYGWVIDSLSFKSVDENDDPEYSDKFGGEGGIASLVTIDWPKEYLTSISGTHNTFLKQHVIESLCFHTNLNTYGPYGGARGFPFDMALKDGFIVGFHGRSSNYIDAIGAYHKSPAI